MTAEINKPVAGDGIEEAQHPLSDELEQHTILTTAETVDRLFLAFRPGVTLSAASLYRNVYDRHYDPYDATAQRARLYIQMMLNPNHSYNGHFMQRCMDEGMAVQAGHMYFKRDAYSEDQNVHASGGLLPAKSAMNADATRRRVYRMFRAEDYIPLLHVGVEMGVTTGADPRAYHIEWEPASGAETEYVPIRQAAQKQREADEKRANRKRREQASRRNSQTSPATEQVAPESDVSADAWEEEFNLRVADVIAQRVEENLMARGDIAASSIRVQRMSTKIGTRTNRERLFREKLVKRDVLSVDSPMTAVELVYAELINTNLDVLGRKMPRRARAKEIVEEMVEVQLRREDEKKASSS